MFRTYVTVLSVGFATLIAALLLVSLRIQPLTGDLTRIGGLSEVDYGWTSPQQRFDQPQYLHTTRLPLPAGDWDLIVFGDSFTDPDRPSAPWLDYVAARSGWRTVAVRYHSVQQIEEFLRSADFRQRPPRLVVIESVTRNMAYRLAQDDCVQPRIRSTAVPVQVEPSHAAPAAVAREHPRRTEFDSTLERLNVASYLLRQSLIYSVLPQLSPVRSYSIGRRNLFSSRRADEVIYYASDVEGQRVPDRQIAAFVCTMAHFRELALTRGSARLLFLPAPDKSVAYAGYAAEAPFDTPAGYDALRTGLGPDFVDTLPLLRAALAQGVQDVYLPNDSHWGHAGALVAADAVLAASAAAPQSRAGEGAN
jgi:hypothetical protein